MKKITKKMVTVVIAASVVALSPAQTFAKDPTPEETAMESYVSNSVVGTWYGTWDEREAVVELKDDGDYYIRFTDDAKPGDVVFTQGKWYADNLSVSFLETLDKDVVTMDYNNVTETLHKTGPDGNDEVFSREKNDDYSEERTLASHLMKCITNCLGIVLARLLMEHLCMLRMAMLK